jgi:tetratricopeptide (TPR) repeat protein
MFPPRWRRASRRPEPCYERALDLYGKLDDRPKQAATLTNLGDMHMAAGRPNEAEEAWRQALAIVDELDPATAEAVRTRLD